MPEEITAEELIHPESLPSAHVPPRVAGEDGLWSPARRPLTLGLVLTITLVAAEALAVSTAMPIVAKDLGGLELYGLVFSAFLIGSLFGIVVVGGLIDRRGVVLPFVIGLVLFAIGLAIGGFAPSMPVLIAARFIQGIGGGTIPPVAYVAIGRSLPESLRPRMFAMLSTAWILPGVLGPAIAGIVAEVFHWRWIFLGLLPLIVISGTMALRGLRPLPRLAATGTGSSLQRLIDAIVLAAGAALVTAGLSSETPALLVGLTAAGILLIGFAFRRLTPAGTLSAARGYPTAVLLRGVLTLAFFCVDAYVALLLVEVRGWSAAEAGIALTAATLSWTAGSWTQARNSTRYRPEQFVRVGFPIVAVGLAGLGLILLPDVPVRIDVTGAGSQGDNDERAVLRKTLQADRCYVMDRGYAQFALFVLRDAPGAIQGTVTAGLTLSDVIGTTLGTGIAAAAVSTAVRQGEGPGPGIGIAIAVGAVVAMLGFLLSPRLRLREDPLTSRAREAGSAGGLG